MDDSKAKIPINKNIVQSDGTGTSCAGSGTIRTSLDDGRPEISHESQGQTVVNQSPAVMGRLLLNSIPDMEPDTKMYIERAENISYHGMNPKEFKATAKSMVKDMQSEFEDQEIFIKALKSQDLDRLIADTAQFLVNKVFSDEQEVSSWGQVLSLLNVFFQIATRLIKERPKESGEALQCLVEQLKDVIRQCASLWIADNGGWLAYDLAKGEKLNMKPATEYLLSSGEPFIVFLSDSPVKGGVRKLANEIVTGFEKVNTTPAILHCGHKHFESLVKEVEFYTKFPTAAFFILIAPSTLQNEQLLACYDAIVAHQSNEDQHKNIVVPIQVFGVKVLPSNFKKYTTLKAFPNSQWKRSEVRDFVGVMQLHFSSLLVQDLNHILAPRTDGQLEVKVRMSINSVKTSDNDKAVLINTIKKHTKSMLDDPWTNIRQHLLHMYKVKNLRVVNNEDDGYICLEIVSARASDIEQILTNYRNAQFESMFTDHIQMSDIFEPHSFSVEIDEGKAKMLIESLKRAVQDGNLKLLQHGIDTLQSREKLLERAGTRAGASTKPQYVVPARKPDDVIKKANVLGKIVSKMLDPDQGYYPYDLYSLLVKQRNEVDLVEVKNDQGHNLQHMIVAASRQEFFKVTFYLNLWDELRLQVTDPEKDPQYGDYTPRGLAEKFLFKSKGPSTLDEYDHFDLLWLQMSLLHKACLRGSLSYVQMLLDRNPDVMEKDQANATCILYACASGSVSIVNLLIEKGADPKLENVRAENGLIMAAKFGKSGVVRLLLSRFDFIRDHVDQYKHRAIDYAAMNGDIEMLQAFRDGGMFPDEKTMSMAAKYQRHEAVVTLVSNYRMEFSGVDEDGRTPLLNSAAKGNYDMLVFLVESGANVQDRDRQNRNCLHLVAEHNHSKACEYLISVLKEKGCLQDLINDRDYHNGRDQLMIVRGRDRGRKAWHYIAIQRTLNCLFKKMGSGQIDVKLFGNIYGSGFGQSPGKEFLKEHEAKLAEKLKDCTLDMSPLLMATWKDHKEVAVQLLEAGANPNVTDRYGSSALHLVAMRGNLELARELEIRDADVSGRNNDNQTPAEIAEVNEHPAVVNFINGKELFKHAVEFAECMEKVKEKLSAEELNKLRSNGKDIRRHLIDTVRDLTIDVNKTLLELGSGPVQEESRDSRELQASRTSSTEFAGPRPELSTLPGISAGESTLKARSLEDI